MTPGQHGRAAAAHNAAAIEVTGTRREARAALTRIAQSNAARDQREPGRRDLRLLVPALTVWALTAAGIGRPGTGALLTLGVLTALGLAAGAWASLPQARPGLRQLLSVGSITLAAVLGISAAVTAGEHARDDPALAGLRDPAARIDALVELTGYPRPGTGAGPPLSWVTAKTHTRYAGPADPDGAPVTVPVAIGIPQGEAAGLGPGNRLRVAGTARATQPGEAAAFLIRADPDTIERRDPGPAQRAAHTLRRTLAELAARVPGSAGELIPGLAVGDTRTVSPELDRAMKRSSLTHLIAVSGSNCAVITGIVTGMLRRLGASGRLRLLAAGASLLGFVLITGPEPSVLRAGVMAAVVLIGLFSGRRSAGLPALAVAILVLLVFDPWQARTAGFALSVLATGGILLGAEPLGRFLGRWLPAWFTPVIAVPVVAQAACQPLLILLEPALPVFGIPANILAAPAAPAATVLGLVACLLGWAVPALGVAAVWLAAAPAAWIAAVAETLAGLPGALVAWPAGWPGAALLAGVELAVLLGALALRHPATRRPAAWALCVAGVVAAVTLLAPPAARLAIPGDWRVAACDVGQGDAVLVRGSSGVLLIDVGDDARALRSCLSTLGVTRIDVLVLSHDHQDHIGALAEVIDRVGIALIAPEPVAELVGRGETPAPNEPDGRRPAAERRPAARLLRAAGIEPLVGRAGDRGDLGDLRWEIVFPGPGSPPESVNAGSLVVSAAAGGIELLALGDLGAPEQARLLPGIPERSPDTVRVVKTAHHGSADQHPELYRRYAATAGLISVGEGNRYDHPRCEALDALRGAGTRALRTDELGTILLSPASGGVNVWSERG